MIDIHSHLIPNFDDGSTSIKESRQIIMDAANDGVTDIICTPHYMEIGKYHASYHDTELAFNLLCENVSNIPIKLHLGNEIFYSKESISEALENQICHTLASSNYCLFELNFNMYDEEIINEIYDLNVCNFQPILAHPERYLFVQKEYHIVEKLISEGCLMQINADSILGYNGKAAHKVALKMLENNHVHFVASDAHNQERCVYMKEAFDVVRHKFGSNVVNDLFVTNPKKILDNEPIEMNRIIKPKRKSLFNIFSK